jgi:Fe-S-cluster-containing hydrogenase component 2
VAPAVIEAVREKAELVAFEPGQIVAEEGKPADAFYLVRGGYVKVSVTAGTADLAVTYLRTGDFAGEASLVLDEPWPFTLQALEHVELVKLARDDFRKILTAQPKVEEKLWQAMVARLKLRGAAARNPVSSEYLRMAMDTGLIHGESVLLIDLTACTAATTGAWLRRPTPGAPHPRGAALPQLARAHRLLQCSRPVCMMDCPTGPSPARSGRSRSDQSATCIGCSNCAKRCPWGNIVMVEQEERRPDGKHVELASKCDLCFGRPEGPACVQMCPHGSAQRISFKDMERVVETLR